MSGECSALEEAISLVSADRVLQNVLLREARRRYDFVAGNRGVDHLTAVMIWSESVRRVVSLAFADDDVINILETKLQSFAAEGDVTDERKATTTVVPVPPTVIAAPAFVAAGCTGLESEVIECADCSLCIGDSQCGVCVENPHTTASEPLSGESAITRGVCGIFSDAAERATSTSELAAQSPPQQSDDIDSCPHIQRENWDSGARMDNTEQRAKRKEDLDSPSTNTPRAISGVQVPKAREEDQSSEPNASVVMQERSRRVPCSRNDQSASNTLGQWTRPACDVTDGNNVELDDYGDEISIEPLALSDTSSQREYLANGGHTGEVRSDDALPLACEHRRESNEDACSSFSEAKAQTEQEGLHSTGDAAVTREISTPVRGNTEVIQKTATYPPDITASKLSASSLQPANDRQPCDMGDASDWSCGNGRQAPEDAVTDISFSSGHPCEVDMVPADATPSYFEESLDVQRFRQAMTTPLAEVSRRIMDDIDDTTISGNCDSAKAVLEQDALTRRIATEALERGTTWIDTFTEESRVSPGEVVTEPRSPLLCTTPGPLREDIHFVESYEQDKFEAFAESNKRVRFSEEALYSVHEIRASFEPHELGNLFYSARELDLMYDEAEREGISEQEKSFTTSRENQDGQVDGRGDANIDVGSNAVKDSPLQQHSFESFSFDGGDSDDNF